MFQSHMTDHEVESNLEQAVREERRIARDILLLIRMVEDRKIFAKRGFSSMFEYLTKHHKYSEGAANRRTQAARLLTQVPLRSNPNPPLEPNKHCWLSSPPPLRLSSAATKAACPHPFVALSSSAPEGSASTKILSPVADAGARTSSKWITSCPGRSVAPLKASDDRQSAHWSDQIPLLSQNESFPAGQESRQARVHASKFQLHRDQT